MKNRLSFCIFVTVLQLNVFSMGKYDLSFDISINFVYHLGNRFLSLHNNSRELDVMASMHFLPILYHHNYH